MRPNKAKRAAAKKTTGARPKAKPVDPKTRAKRRLAQAGRALAKYEKAPPKSAEHVARRDANLARIAIILETWPELAPKPAAA